MKPELQPQGLVNDKVTLSPLQEADWTALYAVASDPLIWEQHPNPDRWQEPVFRNYFTGAMESGGALLVRDAQSGEVVGCSRFYDYLPEKSELKIGYTFFARSTWQKGFNRATKHLMLEHAFSLVDNVIFHVGENNLRSRSAMEKLGAEYLGTEEVAYYGEAAKKNVVYRIQKAKYTPVY